MSRLKTHSPTAIGHFWFMRHEIMKTKLTDRMVSHLQRHGTHSLNLINQGTRPGKKEAYETKKRGQGPRFLVSEAFRPANKAKRTFYGRIGKKQPIRQFLK